MLEVSEHSNPRARLSNNTMQLPAFDVAQDTQTKQKWLETLKSKTSLDGGQAVALCENLNRRMAFTQGPPGTGKTYLGVAIAKVILSSLSSRPKPILVVCLTNHALDSFLEDLRKSGIVRLARLGGGSKEDWTKPYLVKEQSSKLKRTQIENHNLMFTKIRLDSKHIYEYAMTGHTNSWQLLPLTVSDGVKR